MTITDNFILFYGHDWPSNFAPSPITEPDPFWQKEREESTGLWQTAEFQQLTTFRTAEAYYQSRKAIFANDKYSYYKIALAKTPGETKRIAREIKLNPHEWDRVKVKYMWETLQKKFEQNPEMKERLLDPKIGKRKFVEASPTDTFWGVGKSELFCIRDIEEKGYLELFDFNRDLPFGLNVLGELLTNLRNKLLKQK